MKFGLVGNGNIAKVHAKCIDQIEGAHLMGVVCSNSLRYKEIEDQFNSPVFSSLTSLLSSTSVDAISVCNESGNHGEAILEASSAKKHVLCEKPLEITVDKIDAILECISQNQTTLAVAFQNRTHPEYLKLKKALSEDIIGKPLLLCAQIHWYRDEKYYKSNPWRGTLKWDGGAALINQGIHTLDLVLDLMGEVEFVNGTIATQVHQIEGEDTAVAQLRFKNGVLGTLSGGTCLHPGFPEKIEIYGEKGRLTYEAGKIIDAPDKNLITTLSNDENKSSGTALLENIALHKNIYEDFISAIQQNKSPLVSGQSARKSVALINAIYQSSSTNKTILCDTI